MLLYEYFRIRRGRAEKAITHRSLRLWSLARASALPRRYSCSSSSSRYGRLLPQSASLARSEGGVDAMSWTWRSSRLPTLRVRAYRPCTDMRQILTTRRQPNGVRFVMQPCHCRRAPYALHFVRRSFCPSVPSATFNIVYECHINFGADESTRQTWFVDNSGNGYRSTLQWGTCWRWWWWWW